MNRHSELIQALITALDVLYCDNDEPTANEMRRGAVLSNLLKEVLEDAQANATFEELGI